MLICFHIHKHSYLFQRKTNWLDSTEQYPVKCLMQRTGCSANNIPIMIIIVGKQTLGWFVTVNECLDCKITFINIGVSEGSAYWDVDLPVIVMLTIKVVVSILCLFAVLNISAPRNQNLMANSSVSVHFHLIYYTEIFHRS